MVIGESRFFTLDATPGLDITEYTARYELVKDRSIVNKGELTNDGSKFYVKIQTDTLQVGSYEVRIFITDPIDGYIKVLTDSFVLEK